MADQNLVELVCKNLSNPDTLIDFFDLLYSDNFCLDNPLSILRVRAVNNDTSLPKKGIWHKHYNFCLNGSNNIQSIGIPLEVLDRYRKNGCDPDKLDLLIHYVDSNKLDVYIGSVN